MVWDQAGGYNFASLRLEGSWGGAARSVTIILMDDIPGLRSEKISLE